LHNEPFDFVIEGCAIQFVADALVVFPLTFEGDEAGSSEDAAGVLGKESFAPDGRFGVVEPRFFKLLFPFFS
jgi:hypothetical protein